MKKERTLITITGRNLDGNPNANMKVRCEIDQVIAGKIVAYIGSVLERKNDSRKKTI